MRPTAADDGVNARARRPRRRTRAATASSNPPRRRSRARDPRGRPPAPRRARVLRATRAASGPFAGPRGHRRRDASRGSSVRTREDPQARAAASRALNSSLESVRRSDLHLGRDGVRRRRVLCRRRARDAGQGRGRAASRTTAVGLARRVKAVDGAPRSPRGLASVQKRFCCARSRFQTDPSARRGGRFLSLRCLLIPARRTAADAVVPRSPRDSPSPAVIDLSSVL